MGRFWSEISTNRNLYLMLMPATMGFIVFSYLPIYGLIIAFKNYDIITGFFDSPWVGFQHFRNFFEDPYFGRILRNTLILGLYTIVFGFWPPIVFAILLNEVVNSKIKKVFQTISYLPHFIAVVVVVGMMMEFLGPNGIINHALSSLGFDNIMFFNNHSYFRSLFVASDIWQGMGYSSILYLAALSGIDKQLYDASYIDGANRWQRIYHISIPGIMPTIVILLILNSSHIVNVGFEKVFLMQNPVIYETADVIQTYVYRKGVIDRNFSYATAVGLFNSMLAFIILYCTNRISRSLKQNSLW